MESFACVVAAEVQVQNVVVGYYQMPVVEVVVVVVEDPRTNHYCHGFPSKRPI